MSKVSLASRFAHLIGLSSVASPAALAAGATKPAAEEDEKRKRKDGESDEDYDKRMKELDDADAKAAEDDKEKDEKKKDEDAKAISYADGFKAGGKRWEDVLAHAEAGGRMVLACSLLADTDMAAPAIITSLAACPRENRATLATRQAAEPPVPSPAPGAQPAATGSDAEWAANVAKTADQFRVKRA